MSRVVDKTIQKNSTDNYFRDRLQMSRILSSRRNYQHTRCRSMSSLCPCRWRKTTADRILDLESPGPRRRHLRRCLQTCTRKHPVPAFQGSKRYAMISCRLPLLSYSSPPLPPKKSLPLLSTMTNAGKFLTSIFQTASIPSSLNSNCSTFVMQSRPRRAAGPPMLPK